MPAALAATERAFYYGWVRCVHLLHKKRVFVADCPRAGGDASGFVKIVWHNGALAGICALGHGVSHLVTAAQLLLLGQYHGDALHAFMFAHPTLDEALHAALEAPREEITA